MKAAQCESFSKEIQTLRRFEKFSSNRSEKRKRKAILKKTSSLHRLGPFLNRQGIFRVGGRLTRDSTPYHVKHPVIL